MIRRCKSGVVTGRKRMAWNPSRRTLTFRTTAGGQYTSSEFLRTPQKKRKGNQRNTITIWPGNAETNDELRGELAKPSLEMQRLKRLGPKELVLERWKPVLAERLNSREKRETEPDINVKQDRGRERERREGLSRSSKTRSRCIDNSNGPEYPLNVHRLLKASLPRALRVPFPQYASPTRLPRPT